MIVAAKGAAEAIAEHCHLSDEDRARERSAADEMAREGMRVLGLAKASVPSIALVRIPRVVSHSSIWAL